VAIVVEDGTVVAGANSYITLDEARDFAEARGVSDLSDVDATLETLLIRAVDYIEAREVDMAGDRVSTEQPLSWPRTPWGVPKNIKDAQGHLVLAVHAGVNLLPTTTYTAAQTKKKKVGPIEVEYVVSGGSALPRVTSAEGMLAPYIGSALVSVTSRAPRTY
jgi:hypothetical protein